MLFLGANVWPDFERVHGYHGFTLQPRRYCLGYIIHVCESLPLAVGSISLLVEFHSLSWITHISRRRS